MTSPTCPNCGHRLDDHDGSHPAAPTGSYRSLDHASGPGEYLPPVPDIGTDHGNHLSSPQSTSDAPTKRAQLRTAVVALGVVVAGIVAAAFLFGGADPAATADPNETADNSGSSGSTQGAVGETSSTSDPPRGDPNFPPSDDHMAADSIGDLFSSLVDDGQRWSAIYPSPLGLQVLNAFGANEPAVEVAVGFEEAARFPIISDGSTSWAINPNGLKTAFLVSTQFVVIDIDREGRVAFVNDSLDPPNIGESSFGAWGPGFDLPAGAQVIPVSGRALFVLPSTGGTFEYVTNGVIPFSDDVLVAASTQAEVFEQCDDQLVCELYAVTPAIPEGIVLDFDVRSEIWISPSGDMLIAQAPDAEPQLVWLETGERRTLNGPIRAVDWAEDGSRAAILSNNELTMLLPDNSMASVTLPIEPVGAAVLLVSSTE